MIDGQSNLTDTMYGKIFESLYEGSMVGAGALMFAVWGYIITNMKADGKPGERRNAQVDVNPDLLAFILGEEPADVMDALNKLCQPDPKSSTPDEEGRRLVKIGQFTYRVVNGAKYMNIRTAEERRQYFRDAKRRERAKKDAMNNGPKSVEQAMKDAKEDRPPRKKSETNIPF